MIVTIYQDTDKNYILLGSKDKRFAETWGSVYKVPVRSVYIDLESVTRWANNELNEECLFEIA